MSQSHHQNLPGYRKWATQVLWPPLLGVLPRVTIHKITEVSIALSFHILYLYQIHSSSNHLSPSLPLPNSPSFTLNPPTKSVLLSTCPPYTTACYLAFLGLWIVVQLSCTLLLISTNKWVHTIWIFLDQDYLTQDDFFFSQKCICLQISLCLWSNGLHPKDTGMVQYMKPHQCNLAYKQTERKKTHNHLIRCWKNSNTPSC